MSKLEITSAEIKDDHYHYKAKFGKVEVEFKTKKNGTLTPTLTPFSALRIKYSPHGLVLEDRGRTLIVGPPIVEKKPKKDVKIKNVVVVESEKDEILDGILESEYNDVE